MMLLYCFLLLYSIGMPKAKEPLSRRLRSANFDPRNDASTPWRAHTWETVPKGQADYRIPKKKVNHDEQGKTRSNPAQADIISIVPQHQNLPLGTVEVQTRK